jgi:GNAT superfamily N-acetyltransferase
MANASNGRRVEILGDGTRIVVRPIGADDLERHRAFVEDLSPTTRHYRFLAGIGHLSPTALRRLCDLDYEHDMAYIALVDVAGNEKEVGVARYAWLNATEGAEIAVTVTDEWQHRGIGTVLLQRLVEYARSRGVRRLFSIDASENRPARLLARKVGFKERLDPTDRRQVLLTMELDGGEVS